MIRRNIGCKYLGPLLAVAVSASLLQSQPRTERLPDISSTREKFGVDIGGTLGPLSPFQPLTSSLNWRERTAALSYMLRPYARHAVRAVVWIYQSDRLRESDLGTPYEATERTRARFVSLGAMVDIFDKPLVGTGAGSVRMVAALGSGLIPFSSRRFDYTRLGDPGFLSDRASGGVGVQATGTLGLRWKHLAIDQQLSLLAASGHALLERAVVTPVTMGVRF